MNKEKENLSITELNKNLEKISALVVKIKLDYHELCILKDMRITNLEKENKKLKDKLNNLSSVAAVRLANWQKYEKENTELKEKLAGAERTRDNLVQLGFPTFKSYKKYVALIKKMTCCGNCGKWENCEKDEMFSQDICDDWELRG